MSTNTYAIEYIKRATSNNTLEAPDKQKAGDDYQILLGVYESHCKKNTQGAREAWVVLRKVAPHLDKKIKRIHADDLKSIKIPEYAVKDYPVYDLGTNLIIGTRGAGKSFVALDIAGKIALKNPTRTVYYCAGEAISSYAPRWEAWKKHNKQHPKNIFFWDSALSLLKPEEVQEFKAAALPDKPCFIIIDTVARSMAGANENDTSVMSMYANEAEELAKEFNAGLLLVHHEGRNGMQRGSSALDGAVDSVIVVKRNDRILTLHNDIDNGGKNRHDVEAEPKDLEFLPIEIELNGYLRTSAVIVPMPEDEDDKKYSPKQMMILEALEAHKQLTGADVISVTGISRSTCYKQLTELIKKNVVFFNQANGFYTLESQNAHTVRQ